MLEYSLTGRLHPRQPKFWIWSVWQKERRAFSCQKVTKFPRTQSISLWRESERRALSDPAPNLRLLATRQTACTLSIREDKTYSSQWTRWARWEESRFSLKIWQMATLWPTKSSLILTWRSKMETFCTWQFPKSVEFQLMSPVSRFLI